MKKEFLKLLNSIDYSKNGYDIFSDFLTLSSLSIANAFYRSPDLEEEYMRTVKRYKDVSKFPVLFNMIVEEFERNPFQDLLGEIYMSSEFGNKHTGQFFTPFHLSVFMAQMTLGNIKELFNGYDYFTLGEPACGSGGMIIAAAKVIKEAGFNPQQCMYFKATDIDVKCFQMTYIQTSLLGLCGDVELGNTLTLETHRIFETPLKFNASWQARFAAEKFKVQRKQENQEPKEEVKPKVIELPKNKDFMQLGLFQEVSA